MLGSIVTGVFLNHDAKVDVFPLPRNYFKTVYVNVPSLLI